MLAILCGAVSENLLFSAEEFETAQSVTSPEASQVRNHMYQVLGFFSEKHLTLNFYSYKEHLFVSLHA